MTNVVPLPFSLSTSMVPFIISTMLFVMASPSPVLPYWFALCASSWLNVSKMRGRKSLSMPMPVSLTVKRRVDLPANCAVRSTRSCTEPPSGVNFTALPSTLTSV